MPDGAADIDQVLQVLLFCTPFYGFLDQISRNAVHSFKSETPLIDAMIMFMKEFRVIARASSVEQLQERIKGTDQKYGDPLTPNFLYDEMKRSKWFATLEVWFFLTEPAEREARETNKLTARTSARCGGVLGLASPSS
jgi:hypothetical protein